MPARLMSERTEFHVPRAALKWTVCVSGCQQYRRAPLLIDQSWYTQIWCLVGNQPLQTQRREGPKELYQRPRLGLPGNLLVAEHTGCQDQKRRAWHWYNPSESNPSLLERISGKLTPGFLWIILFHSCPRERETNTWIRESEWVGKYACVAACVQVIL